MNHYSYDNSSPVTPPAVRGIPAVNRKKTSGLPYSSTDEKRLAALPTAKRPNGPWIVLGLLVLVVWGFALALAFTG